MMTSPRIAVLLPCHNEAAAIAQTVADFRAACPAATIYVYDNCSTDDTAALARAAGALVRHESRRGKGNVVRRMFADVDADIYVLADGDGTYDAAAAARMIERLVDEQLDMVIGTRQETHQLAYRPVHRFGNRLFSRIVSRLFGQRVEDLLSGYRIMSRRFVKSFPALSQGFEIETELTVHVLELRLPFAEEPTAYAPRMSGSASKLSTWRDGRKILQSISMLIKDAQPLRFFGLIGVLLATTSIVLVIPVFITFFETGLVPRVPTAVLATGMMLLAFLLAGTGLVLEGVARTRREACRLAYLAIPGIGMLSAPE